MTRPSPFGFYEKVKISSTDARKAGVWGEVGAVLGQAQSAHGRWSYAIWVYRDSLCYSTDEEELEPVGEFDRREMFYGQ